LRVAVLLYRGVREFYVLNATENFGDHFC
jgi:hypothetical protein